MANRNNLGHRRHQFGKLKRCKTIGVEDGLSALPDELLSHILTSLTLKEAIATSILSRRWEKLWVAHPILDFGRLKSYNLETYVHRVNQILRQYNGQELRKFRIVYPMYEYIGPHVDDWTSFAIRNGVSELELDFDKSRGNYYFPACAFLGQEVMNLKHRSSSLTTFHFESLRDLCLRSVNLSDEVFEIILSSCFSLERFLLMFSRGLVNAKNTAPHLKLKSLELYICGDLVKLELLAPNLTSFKYEGRQRTLCIKDAHKLSSLSLSTYFAPDPNPSLAFSSRKDFFFSQFSSYLPKLESLIVPAHLFEDMRDLTELSVFSNLKHLLLDAIDIPRALLGFQVVASIIRAAPYLELLEMILPGTNPSWSRMLRTRTLELASMSPHTNLKRVRLFGFRGDNNARKFLAYLLEYAVCLEKIDVTPCSAIMHGDKLCVFRDIKWNADDSEFCDNCVLQLRQALRANAQLLVHDWMTSSLRVIYFKMRKPSN